MSTISTLFVTRLYRNLLTGRRAGDLNRELAATCQLIAAEDQAGQAWSQQHGYAGYTSYASLDDLCRRAPAFADLELALDGHVAAFAKELQLDLDRRRLVRDSMWINVLLDGGAHTGHIHPGAVISGTYYVAVPPGAGAIRFEDPRLPLMMAAPPRKTRARLDNRTFVEVAPKAGEVLLWESWLRHEVLPNRVDAPRVSVSFNYRLEP